MTTTISSGNTSDVWGGAIGDSVKITKLPIQGVLTQISFGKRTLRGCVDYVDQEGKVQTEWVDLDDLFTVSS